MVQIKHFFLALISLGILIGCNRAVIKNKGATMDKTKFTHGQLHWSEYCSDDSKGTVEFCNKLFGWEVMFQPSDNEYFLKHGETPIVSVFQHDDNAKKEGVPIHTKNYVAVKDYDGTLRKALDNGATLIMENADPSGAHKLAVLKIPGNILISIVEYYK